MSKNCYDDETFFQGYKKIRESQNNYNDLLEQPAMRDYMPDVRGKKILDLGCGYGRNCVEFAEGGALRVVGIDSSKRMLETANKESVHPNVEYMRLEAERLHEMNETFDIVYSSLVFHYIEDFEKLVLDISSVLKGNGVLLFSQEHPIITASPDKGLDWNYDDKGREISYTFTNYNRQGRRGSHWFIDDVITYHRTMGTIVTTLADNGFHIDALYETAPKPFAVQKNPKLRKEFLKPNFLIIRARKMRILKEGLMKNETRRFLL